MKREPVVYTIADAIAAKHRRPTITVYINDFPATIEDLECLHELVLYRQEEVTGYRFDKDGNWYFTTV